MQKNKFTSSLFEGANASTTHEVGDVMTVPSYSYENFCTVRYATLVLVDVSFRHRENL